jgi:large subunit ribosomal protein L10
MRSHTRHWKEKQLAELKKLIDDSKVVAIASIESIPASLFQELRGKLSGTANIKVSKRRLIAKALSESKYKGLGLEKYIKGQIALITSSIDPFELYSILKKNKVKTYLRAGSIADKDIVVPAGDTGLAPGPDLSILKAANIPAVMKGSSIQVPKDTVVVHKGEQVTQEVANALIKLDIKPAEIMLKILAATDGSTLYEASVLDIDTEKFEQDLITCYRNAFNLAFNIEYIMPQNIELFLQKAFNEAKALATEAEIINSVTLPEFLAKAYVNASALGGLVKLAEPEPEPKPEQKEQEQGTEEEKKEQEQGTEEEKKEQEQGQEGAGSGAESKSEQQNN